MQTSTAQPAPKPRNPALPFDAVPRYWLGGSRIATQIANGVNLLFPDGERFFVRSVHHFKQQLEQDPELWAQIRGFSSQEGRHAGAHERFFQILEQQGFDTRTFMKLYRKVAYDWIERAAPPELRLSATVALEHYTALLAEQALSEGGANLHPQMRSLMLWHAAEEIEHKSVAFDALKRINPSYRLRMGGLVMATATLGGFWVAATLMLLAQEGAITREDLAKHRELTRDKPSLGASIFARGIREYIRRDFHPSQLSNEHLATEYLAEVGMALSGISIQHSDTKRRRIGHRLLVFCRLSTHQSAGATESLRRLCSRAVMQRR